MPGERLRGFQREMQEMKQEIEVLRMKVEGLISVALRTYRQPIDDKKRLKLATPHSECASMLSNLGGG